MKQSEFLAVTSKLLKAREKLRLQGAFGFGFASHWFTHWREISTPITLRGNGNWVITFHVSHLKTALSMENNLFLVSILMNI